MSNFTDRSEGHHRAEPDALLSELRMIAEVRVDSFTPQAAFLPIP
jgi:hypothetical protein